LTNNFPFDTAIPMSYINIRVIAYSGYRVNESPRTFVINDETRTVVEILDKWIEEGFANRVRRRFFIVKADNDRHYKIYYDETTSEWFCEME
jgi:hypothetical protein